MAATGLAEAPAITTVILVRHAEKVDESEDAQLSAAGVERSRELARVLTAVPLAAIYTTPFARTRNTAKPVATACHIEPIEVPAGKTLAADNASRISTQNRGQTVLVVGHSNSVPNTMRALGIKDPPAIADSEFDRLFICTLVDGAESRCVALRYGKSTP